MNNERYLANLKANSDVRAAEKNIVKLAERIRDAMGFPSIVPLDRAVDKLRAARKRQAKARMLNREDR